ncbi:MAG: hypothetical protein ACON34_02475 [Flavobacteriales bacterium]
MSFIRNELDALSKGREDFVNELNLAVRQADSATYRGRLVCPGGDRPHHQQRTRYPGYLVKKTSSGWDEIPERTPETDAAAGQLHAALESDGKWGFPVKFPPPAPDMTLDKLAHTWMHSHNDIAHWIGATPDGIEDKLVFKHPIAGRITLDQTLGFLQRHIPHHRFQLERIKAAIN